VGSDAELFDQGGVRGALVDRLGLVAAAGRVQGTDQQRCQPFPLRVGRRQLLLPMFAHSGVA